MLRRRRVPLKRCACGRMMPVYMERCALCVAEWREMRGVELPARAERKGPGDEIPY